MSALWNEPVVLNGHAEVQTLVWFHVAGIATFTFITLGLVMTPLLQSKVSLSLSLSLSVSVSVSVFLFLFLPPPPVLSLPLSAPHSSPLVS